MSEHTCLKEHQWGEVETTMKNISEALARMEKRMCSHIEEGERPGGVRDRVTRIEWEVSELKKRFWASAIIGGVIGALIGSGSGEVITLFINWIMNIK